VKKAIFTERRNWVVNTFASCSVGLASIVGPKAGCFEWGFLLFSPFPLRKLWKVTTIKHVRASSFHILSIRPFDSHTLLFGINMNCAFECHYIKQGSIVYLAWPLYPCILIKLPYKIAFLAKMLINYLRNKNIRYFRASWNPFSLPCTPQENRRRWEKFCSLSFHLLVNYIYLIFQTEYV
jgi:hypothetical protein